MSRDVFLHMHPDTHMHVYVFVSICILRIYVYLRVFICVYYILSMRIYIYTHAGYQSQNFSHVNFQCRSRFSRGSRVAKSTQYETTH